MIIRARIILPISSPPVEDGAVKITENRIAALERWRDLKTNPGPVVDLGDAIILPGLINAHCHLDYTDMAGMISPQKSFSSWIKAMLALKSHWSYSEYAQSWIHGAKMLLRTGTTTVADIEAVPELLPEVWSTSPLRVLSLLELTGVKSRRVAREIISEAARRIESLAYAKNFMGLSPHALYSTSPDLLKRSAEIAREKNWVLSTHVAESEEEMEMFLQGRGALFEWLKSQRDMADVGASPVELLDRQGMLTPNFAAVHANYISKSDAALLAKRHCSVVHCPRSHDYFGHNPFPRKILADAGINIALGTDSLASIRKQPAQPVELNMFSEMQSFAKANPDVSAEKILQMATINGARALGMQKQIGELTPNAFADLIALRFSGKISEAHEAVLQHKGEVLASIIDGNWVVKP
ncbi:MAG: amidohydrolase family protein [Verrucomicrobiota bacterium]